jgi:SnoaL-like domain
VRAAAGRRCRQLEVWCEITVAVVNQKDADGLVREIEDAWNSHDMRRFAACFAADADFVNVVGAWWRGRAEIEEKHYSRSRKGEANNACPAAGSSTPACASALSNPIPTPSGAYLSRH